MRNVSAENGFFVNEKNAFPQILSEKIYDKS